MSQEVYGPVDEHDLRDAKADAKIAAESGYDPESAIKIPMTHELRAAIDQYKLFSATKELENGQILRNQTLEEEKEAKSAKQRDIVDSAYDAIQDKKWLESEHVFAGYELSGREMQHVGEYYRDNKQSIQDGWHEKGYDPARIKNWDWYIETASTGGPKTESEKARFDQIEGDKTLQHEFKGIIETSGVEATPTVKAVTSSVEKPAVNQAAEMSLSL